MASCCLPHKCFFIVAPAGLELTTPVLWVRTFNHDTTAPIRSLLGTKALYKAINNQEAIGSQPWNMILWFVECQSLSVINKSNLISRIVTLNILSVPCCWYKGLLTQRTRQISNCSCPWSQKTTSVRRHGYYLSFFLNGALLTVEMKNNIYVWNGEKNWYRPESRKSRRKTKTWFKGDVVAKILKTKHFSASFAMSGMTQRKLNAHGCDASFKHFN